MTLPTGRPVGRPRKYHTAAERLAVARGYARKYREDRVRRKRCTNCGRRRDRAGRKWCSTCASAADRWHRLHPVRRPRAKKAAAVVLDAQEVAPAPVPRETHRPSRAYWPGVLALSFPISTKAISA